MCVNRRQIDPNVKKDKVGPAQFDACQWEAQVVGQLQAVEEVAEGEAAVPEQEQEQGQG